MKKIILYIPKEFDHDRISSLKRVLRNEAELLGLRYEERRNKEDYLMVYYKDNEVSTFLYIEDEPDETVENIRMMIRVLALIAMRGEEKEVKKEIVEVS